MTTQTAKKLIELPFDRGDHVEMAIRMIEMLRREGPLVVDHGRLYQYDDDFGIWEVVDKGTLRGRLQVFAGAPVIAKDGTRALLLTHASLEGAARCILDRPDLQHDGFFDDAPLGVAFENGFVTIDFENAMIDEHGATMLKLVDHEPDNRARWSAPCDWDPVHPGGSWRSFLRSIFPGDDQEGTRSLIQEYAGASLLGIASRLQTCMVWIGEGANGKGTLTETLGALFPRGGCVSVPPSKWGKDSHLVAFENALLNIVDELPAQAITESATFKAIIAGDLITADRKYMSPVTFRPKAGHVFSAQELPEWHDPSHGMWRRLIPIEFRRIFRVSDPDWIPRDELNASLEDDLPGIYACILRAGARVAVTSRYTIPKASKAFKDEWKGDAMGPVELWASMGEKVGAGDDWEPVEDRYRLFVKWAKLRGVKPLSRPAWARRLSVLGWERRRLRDHWESRPGV